MYDDFQTMWMERLHAISHRTLAVLEESPSTDWTKAPTALLLRHLANLRAVEEHYAICDRHHDAAIARLTKLGHDTADAQAKVDAWLEDHRLPRQAEAFLRVRIETILSSRGQSDQGLAG